MEKLLINSIVLRWILFAVLATIFTYISRRPLSNPRSHGFYRYFAFVGIAALVLYNQPVWFADPFSTQHCLSWLLLVISIFLVVYGSVQLLRSGGRQERHSSPENLSFENTSCLVVDGLYRYIRHPMYASLLFLGWGSFLKQIDPFTGATVALVTLALFFTAKVEEIENINFFGSEYIEYCRTSKMFIPFIY